MLYVVNVKIDVVYVETKTKLNKTKKAKIQNHKFNYYCSFVAYNIYDVNIF